jgi:glycosyltransferase 2 family protein
VKGARIFSFAGKVVVVAMLVWYIWKTVIANWGEVRSYNWDFDPVFMILSLLVFAAGYAFLAWIWGKVLGYVGCGVSFKAAFDIYFIGNLGRYLPGKVWTIAGTALMAERRGICPVTAGTASVFAQGYSIISSFVFFCMFFILRKIQLPGARFEWAALALVAFTVVFMVPSNMERAVNLMLSLVRRPTVKLGLTVGKASKIVGWYFLSWLTFGIAFWLFVISVTGDRDINPLFLAGAYAVAYVLGFLAFFVPGGLGVREGLLSVLLSSVIPMGVALLIAFLLRLVVTLIELGCVLVIIFPHIWNRMRGSLFRRKGVPNDTKETSGG